jgi:hypothetical protein
MAGRQALQDLPEETLHGRGKVKKTHPPKASRVLRCHQLWINPTAQHARHPPEALPEQRAALRFHGSSQAAAATAHQLAHRFKHRGLPSHSSPTLLAPFVGGTFPRNTPLSKCHSGHALNRSRQPLTGGARRCSFEEERKPTAFLCRTPIGTGTILGDQFHHEDGKLRKGQAQIVVHRSVGPTDR